VILNDQYITRNAKDIYYHMSLIATLVSLKITRVEEGGDLSLLFALHVFEVRISMTLCP
jgi:hypothetical protein